MGWMIALYSVIHSTSSSTEIHRTSVHWQHLRNGIRCGFSPVLRERWGGYLCGFGRNNSRMRSSASLADGRGGLVAEADLQKVVSCLWRNAGACCRDRTGNCPDGEAVVHRRDLRFLLWRPALPDFQWGFAPQWPAGMYSLWGRCPGRSSRRKIWGCLADISSFCGIDMK